MNREHVKITVEPTVVDGTVGQTIGVALNDAPMGEYFVPKGDPLVAQALLLAGYSTVSWAGAGWPAQSLDQWQLRKQVQQGVGRVSPSLTGERGTIELKKFFVEGSDHCMVDMFFNGVGAWKWAEPDLRSLDVLATILREAPFQVEVAMLDTVVHLCTTPVLDAPVNEQLPENTEERQAA